MGYTSPILMDGVSRTRWMNPKILLMALAQACYWFAVLIGVSLSSVIGLSLAPQASWATLPYALISVGALLATYRLSLLMQQHGRRFGFQIGSIAGVIAGLLTIVALYDHNFYLFCVASFIMGGLNSFHKNYSTLSNAI